MILFNFNRAMRTIMMKIKNYSGRIEILIKFLHTLLIKNVCQINLL